MMSPHIHTSQIEWWTPSIDLQKKDARWVLESVLVHVAAFGLIFLLDRVLPKPELVPEEPKATIEIQIPTHFETVPAPIPEQKGSFSGSSGGGGGKATGTQSAAERAASRANAIATGLSRVAQTLAFSKTGSIAAGQSKVRSSSGSNVQTSQVLTGLTKVLGKNRSTGLGQEVTKLGSGAFAKGIRWDMFSSKKEGLTAEEEREINRVFKGIDGELRDCYEAALLRDESLSVVMKMMVRVERGRFVSPRFDLTGSATPSGESSLKGCMVKVFQKYRVRESISDVDLKMERIFK